MIGARSHRRRAAVPIAACLAAVATASRAESPLLSEFNARVERDRTSLVELRHDLHRHPELSGQEERTAGVVAERLRGLGFEVRTGVGGHGVVGVLRGATPGPVVAYRADMDAMPSDAPDPADFRSLEPGVRHICGHDLHTTVGVAIASGFAAVADRFPGTLMLLFQPAEENATGAKAMIADGALEPLRPDYVIGVHTAPFEVGRLATAPEVLMAGRDRVAVTVERADDPDAAAAAVRERLQALSTLTPAQSLQPAAPGFVLVQQREPRPTEGGGRLIEASITVASPETRARTRAAVEAIVAELEAAGQELSLDYEERFIAGVDNDPALVERTVPVIESVLGEGAVIMVPAVVPAFSEDFGSFQALVPGVFYFLGVSNAAKGIVGMPHSPGYAADDDAIEVGARAMGAVLLDLLASPQPAG